jgi:hypothetical protein
MKKFIFTSIVFSLVSFGAFANVNPSGCVMLKEYRTGKPMVGFIDIKFSQPNESYGNVVTFIQDIHGTRADKFYGRALNDQVNISQDTIILSKVFMSSVGDGSSMTFKLTNELLQIGKTVAPRIQCPK